MGRDEEAESRQQEVGRGDVEQSEAREVESRQQEAGCGDVEYSEGREAESRQQEAGHAERRGRGQSE